MGGGINVADGREEGYGFAATLAVTPLGIGSAAWQLLLLSKDALDLHPELGYPLYNDSRYQVEIDTQVVMDNDVTKRSNIAPWDFRVTNFQLFRNAPDGLAEKLKVMENRILFPVRQRNLSRPS
jgi:hypothetical protein